MSKNSYFKELYLKQMSQWLIVLIGAILVGLIVLGVASSYTTATSAKLPNTSEMVKIFVSGSIVGGFISWLLSNGYFHGKEIIGMISSDVSYAVKEIGLKGGVDNMASSPVSTSDMSAQATKMIGGFFNSLGLGGNNSEGPSLNIGMPSF